MNVFADGSHTQTKARAPEKNQANFPFGEFEYEPQQLRSTARISTCRFEDR
jgi:hypothetical protein